MSTRLRQALMALAACTLLHSAQAANQDVLYTLDLRALNNLDLKQRVNAERLWDTLHAVAALQGLANRDSAKLYVFYCGEFGVDTDQFWFDWLREEDGWLKQRPVRQLSGLEQAVTHLRSVYKGLVVYDPAVPATANLASTAAGVEALLPVRYDPNTNSIFHLLARQLALPVKLWLVREDGRPLFTGSGKIPDTELDSTGSAKVDAYLWGIDRYLTSGKCAPGLAGYYIDSFWLDHPAQAGPTMHTLSNHDYFIARRAFFFDLSPWGDEKPNDDLRQPLGADRTAFLKVMRALYDRADGALIKVGGFPPWPYKYTTHAQPPCKYEGVPTEWEFGRLISQFNGYMEADAAGLGAMANASLYQHYPLQKRYRQPNAKPTLNALKERGCVDADGSVAPKFFVAHYVGDYDCPSWLYKAVPKFMRDPARGQVPLGWAFDPNLADRAPQALAYAYRNATTNDFFIAGDSGAGYLNPRALTVRPDSGLPPALPLWSKHCSAYYHQWDMSITGFILDGSGGQSTDKEFAAFQSFSPDGAGTHFEPGVALHSGMPTCPERDLPDDAAEAAKAITELAKKSRGKPGFLWARSILKSPSWYVEVSRLLRDQKEVPVAVVDPYSFFQLIRIQLQDKN